MQMMLRWSQSNQKRQVRDMCLLPIFSEVLLNDLVVRQRNALLVDLAIASLCRDRQRFHEYEAEDAYCR